MDDEDDLDEDFVDVEGDDEGDVTLGGDSSGYEENEALMSDAVDDPVTDDISQALQAVNSALMHGRQSLGLSGNAQSAPQPATMPGDEDGEDILNDADEDESETPQLRGASAADEDQGYSPGMPSRQGIPDDRPTKPNPELQARGLSAIPSMEAQEQPSNITQRPTPTGAQSPNRFERALDQYVVQPARGAMDRMKQTAMTALPPEVGDGDITAKIMRYLQGTDAAPPQAAHAAERQVDPSGQLDENKRKLAAVAEVARTQGNEAAFALVQHYRKQYESYRGFANAALEQGDLAGAARAATQAYPNVPDGTSVTFAPGRGGVTATVTGPDGQPRQYPMSTEQFREFLSGSSGQFDHLLATGAEKAIQGGGQQMAQQAPAAPPAQQAPQPRQGIPTGGAPGARRDITSQFVDPRYTQLPNAQPSGQRMRIAGFGDPQRKYFPGLQGQYQGNGPGPHPFDPVTGRPMFNPFIPGKETNLHVNSDPRVREEDRKENERRWAAAGGWVPKPDGTWGPDPTAKYTFPNRGPMTDRDRDRQAVNEAMPWASQSKARGTAMLQMENTRRDQQSRERRAIEPAQIRANQSDINNQRTNQSRLDVANRRGESYDLRTRSNDLKVLQQLDAQERRDRNAEDRSVRSAQTQLLREKIRNGEKLTPQEQEIYNRILGGGSQQPSGGGGQQQPQSQGSSSSRPPLAQRVVGKTYNTPRGPLIWEGNGWRKP